MKYAVYVNDARNGTSFRFGFKSGWLHTCGAFSWRKGAKVFTNRVAAYKAISDLGATDNTDVIPGKITAYVCEA